MRFLADGETFWPFQSRFFYALRQRLVNFPGVRAYPSKGGIKRISSCKNTPNVQKSTALLWPQ
jgi:hypothetical protein